MFRMKNITSLLLFLIMIVSCTRHEFGKDNTLDFNPMLNFPEGDTVHLDMDLKGVVNRGIEIPSARQCEEGAFVFSFEGEAGMYYKIYYQNESYKFPNDHALSYENFYGSWEDVRVGFKKITTTGKVFDSVRIVGNPRDERKYYGENLEEVTDLEQNIQEMIRTIKNNPEWYNTVVQKAAENNISVQCQLRRDAKWIIHDRQNTGDCNNRWKRNPRVGCYSFMLVVCDEEALRTLPEYIKNIGETDGNGNFVNPYTFFQNHRIKGVTVCISKRILKTRAVITPEYGLYINELTTLVDDDKPVEGPLMGTSPEFYSNALFEQFFSNVSRQYNLRNIPVIQDVVSDENPYTRKQYEANKTRFDSSQLLYDYPVTSEKPGTTVMVDPSDNSIILINPGNKDPKNLRKESTGIKSRVGFTYGKFRGKIKFPVMLNDENVWNGLTNAFWMIHQANHAWNNRRPSQSGYVGKESEGPNPERFRDYPYSEIDIEIAKASKFWPANYYTEAKHLHVEDASRNSDVIFACTNWDMACLEPPKYSYGVFQMDYGKRKYEAMRWSPTTQAMTIRTPIRNDVFKNDYYYYEIEWRPESITWRLGPSPDNMTVVGYLTDQYSSIPDNQMLCIVTQEYHYSEWWAPVVFWQGLIPYNKSDIKGKVFEIVVE